MGVCVFKLLKQLKELLESYHYIIYIRKKAKFFESLILWLLC